MGAGDRERPEREGGLGAGGLGGPITIALCRWSCLQCPVSMEGCHPPGLSPCRGAREGVRLAAAVSGPSRDTLGDNRRSGGSLPKLTVSFFFSFSLWRGAFHDGRPSWHDRLATSAVKSGGPYRQLLSDWAESLENHDTKKIKVEIKSNEKGNQSGVRECVLTIIHEAEVGGICLLTLYQAAIRNTRPIGLRDRQSGGVLHQFAPARLQGE